jgi:predicted  nucleic acid-binding Zn-ribbon protein
VCNESFLCKPQIGTDTADARKLSDQSLKLLEELKKRLDDLRKRYFANGLDIDAAEDTINKAEIAAQGAETVSMAKINVMFSL